MNPISDLLKGGLSGIADGAAKIIGTLKADPTKVAEAESALETLKINAGLEADRIANQAEELQARELEARLKDESDARNREIQIANSDKAPLINKIMLPILAALVTVGFFGILGFMLKYRVPEQNQQVLNIMLGSLGTAWIAIVMYYFGSSTGSTDKSRVIEKLTSKV